MVAKFGAGSHLPSAEHLSVERLFPDDSWDPWQCSFVVRTATGSELTVRNVRTGDEDRLAQFGDQLSPQSQDLFSPYPWQADLSARAAFQTAIDRNASRADATFLVLLEDVPIAHVVLWGVVRVHAFRGLNLRIPTLGLAVVDRWHGRGVGSMCLRLAQAVGRQTNLDAIELTTSKDNIRAARLYERAGFVDCGLLQIPLGVDPSTPLSACRTVETWREERHMYYLLSMAKADIILAFLHDKERQHRDARGH
jgi:RimJ/RimL family protein N-acetyltransferase